MRDNKGRREDAAIAQQAEAMSQWCASCPASCPSQFDPWPGNQDTGFGAVVGVWTHLLGSLHLHFLSLEVTGLDPKQSPLDKGVPHRLWHPGNFFRWLLAFLFSSVPTPWKVALIKIISGPCCSPGETVSCGNLLSAYKFLESEDACTLRLCPR